jgi:spore maturation protein CgeB
LIKTLVQAGFHVALYGGYWERYTAARSCSRGHAGPSILRKAISGARVALCLVRRANRDGHVMRSFEVPAMGGCLLVEDTADHRVLFGDDGEAVVYFRTREEMAPKLRWLLDHPDERQRLATAAHRLITTGSHTYRDRLITMLEHAGTMPFQRINAK